MSEPRHDNSLRVFPSLKPIGFFGCLIFIASFLLPAGHASAQRVVADTVVTLTVQPFKPHNPTKALLLSILPGAGQVYNGQAWKIPIIYGALGGVGYFTYTYYKSMKSFKDEYLSRRAGNEPQLEGYTNYPVGSIYNLYQSNNKSFQTFVLITVAVYGLNLIDAYVFGHLYDFQVSDDLSLNLSPSLAPDYSSPTGLSPAVQVTLRF